MKRVSRCQLLPILSSSLMQSETETQSISVCITARLFPLIFQNCWISCV